MKKLVIAGAASVALAALPVLGTFAVSTSSTLTDNLEVTVQGGCTIENAAAQEDGTYADRKFTKSIAAGTAQVLNGGEPGDVTPAMVIKCNVPAAEQRTFTITANGQALTLEGDTVTIPAGDDFAGGTSAWGYSLDGSTWEAAPVAQTTVVASHAASTESTLNFNPTYKVYVAPNQKPGLYKGSITYTVALNPTQP